MPKKRKTKSSRPARQVTSRNSHFSKSVQRFFQQFLTVSSFRTKALLLLGIILVLIPTFFYVNEGVQLAFFTPKVPVIVKTLPVPTWISIPAVQMELPVIEEAISGNTWGVAQDGISHLNVSARPGETGPIILYGHNTNERFGPIRWLSKGARITLTAGGDKHYTYVVEQTQDVSPTQVSILLTQKGQTLILYTCDGFADLQRFVVIAKPL